MFLKVTIIGNQNYARSPYIYKDKHKNIKYNQMPAVTKYMTNKYLIWFMENLPFDIKIKL